MALVENKCKNCGGKLVYDSNTELYRCEFCNASYRKESDGNIHIENINIYPKADTTKEERQKEQSEKMEEEPQKDKKEAALQLFVCPECGTELIVNQEIEEIFCYYCHTQAIFADELKEEFIPDKIIPFKIDKEQAKEIILEQARKKILADTGLLEENIEKVERVYVPFWIENCYIDTTFSDIANEVTITREGDWENIITDRYKVERHERIRFEYFVNKACTGIIEKWTRKIWPFKKEDLVDFAEDYLSGSQIIKVNTGNRECNKKFWRNAEKYAIDVMRKNIPQHTKFEGKQEIRADIKDLKRDCMLVPVWTLVYEDSQKDKCYSVVNGQNGASAGRFPIDRTKSMNVIVEIIVLIVGMLFLYFWNAGIVLWIIFISVIVCVITQDRIRKLWNDCFEGTGNLSMEDSGESDSIYSPANYDYKECAKIEQVETPVNQWIDGHTVQRIIPKEKMTAENSEH